MSWSGTVCHGVEQCVMERSDISLIGAVCHGVERCVMERSGMS